MIPPTFKKGDVVEICGHYDWRGEDTHGRRGIVARVSAAELVHEDEDFIEVRFPDGTVVPFWTHEIHRLSPNPTACPPRPRLATVGTALAALIVVAAILLMALWPRESAACPDPGDNKRAVSVTRDGCR